MTHDVRRSRFTRTALRARGHALVALALVGAVATTLAGCGSSSSSGGEPFPEFEGTWAIDTDASNVNCPDNGGAQSFSLWAGTMTLDAGVLTDLTEVSGICPFNYDVLKKVATLVTPDPYTGAPPTCTVPLSQPGEMVVINPTASPAWVFNLLTPVAGMAPKAQVIGQGDAMVTLLDSNGNLGSLGACTFSANVSLHKIAKP